MLLNTQETGIPSSFLIYVRVQVIKESIVWRRARLPAMKSIQNNRPSQFVTTTTTDIGFKSQDTTVMFFNHKISRTQIHGSKSLCVSLTLSCGNMCIFLINSDLTHSQYILQVNFHSKLFLHCVSEREKELTSVSQVGCPGSPFSAPASACRQMLCEPRIC